MAVTSNAEISKVLEAVLAYLNITLPSQSLSPDAEMGRESLSNMVESLAQKLQINVSSSKAANDAEPAPQEELYDDVNSRDTNDSNGTSEANRQSCYIDMSQQEILVAGKKECGVAANQSAPLVQDTNYEIPGMESESQQDEVIELMEEDDTYDNVRTDNESQEADEASDGISYSEDSYCEFTEEELQLKLKGFENTNPKNILKDSLFSGWLLKQKKKLLSKWHKRYCIVQEEFMFYYQSESDTKCIGVIALPGYKLCEEKSNGKDRFIFKLLPSGKGRSTYLLQCQSKDEFDGWLAVLKPICSQKLDRLSSSALNRLSKKLDSTESEEGSGGEAIKAKEQILEEGDMYEFVPEDGLASKLNQDQVNSPSPIPTDFETYDDFVERETDNMAQQEGEQEDIYEIIETFTPPPRPTDGSKQPPIPSLNLPQRIPNLLDRGPAPPVIDDLYDDHVDHSDNKIQQVVSDDIYEDIAPFQQDVPPPVSIPIQPPSSPRPSLSPAPTLPSRTPVIPERRPVAQGSENSEAPPLPPAIPKRDGNKIEENTELIEEEPDGPLESDFSYENVYIGTDAYSSGESDELTFDRGDLVYVLQKVNTNWWIGCLDMKVGFVPSNLLIAGFAH